jgi:hypothetical protein
MKRLIILVSFSLGLGLSTQAYSDGFWCDGKLISTGITKYEVLHECGEPDYKEVRFEKRIRRDFFRDLFLPDEVYRYREREQYREPFLVEEEMMIEEWTYNLGPTRFIRYLTFENGRLVRITTGDYGF